MANALRSFPTKSDARAWATVIESEMERGVYIDRTEAEKTPSVISYSSAVEVSSQKKGRESERYRVASLLRDPIAKTKVAALSGKLMAQWRDKRLKEVSGSTTNRDLNLISHVINVARKEWGVHVDHPISKIRRPPENRGRTRRLALGEDERLLAALDVPLVTRKGGLPVQAIRACARWSSWPSRRLCGAASSWRFVGRTSNYRTAL